MLARDGVQAKLDVVAGEMLIENCSPPPIIARTLRYLPPDVAESVWPSILTATATKPQKQAPTLRRPYNQQTATAPIQATVSSNTTSTHQATVPPQPPSIDSTRKGTQSKHVIKHGSASQHKNSIPLHAPTRVQTARKRNQHSSGFDPNIQPVSKKRRKRL